MTIDAHQHFWEYVPTDYEWMDDRMAAIKCNLLPVDLLSELGSAGIDGTITVQARQTLEETEWLLGLAARHRFIRGVVGWVPLCSARVEEDLDRLSSDTNLRGVRHVLHDEPDPEFALRDDFGRGIGVLRQYGLAYDLLVFESQLPTAITLVDRHPGQVFVLDHIGKPRIRERSLASWSRDVRRLAERDHCYCKLSGMVTEAHWSAWSPDALRPYFDVVLEAFGPDRLMFGSDWPVCLLACAYAQWRKTVDDWVGQLSEAEQARIMGETAIEAYRIPSSG